ncbi:hypothetical protein NEDG_00115 [Nematocida displodere]|uniref:ATPase AAA-type core domain-containing protein n=1 Tax=Nematocida displodere TaxID=1805483 RepID=A0A177EJT5_9MICR|nr:hypothetical protein NEDG_00115 [Nematocida displodere]
MDGVPPRKTQEARSALKNAKSSVVVLSGPIGCGKTSLVKSLSAEWSYDLVEIDTLDDYMEHRLCQDMVYLIRLSEVPPRKRNTKYRGMVVETENPYLYRQIRDAVPIHMNKPTQKTSRRLLPLARASMDLNTASAISGMPRPLQQRLVDESDEPCTSFFHFLGRILYHKTDVVPEQVFLLLSQNSALKTLTYLHENLPSFSKDLDALSTVLDQVSVAVSRGCREEDAVLLLAGIWAMERSPPKKFFQIRSSHYHEK